ncbi:hypothetical protein WAX78_08185 [Bacillus sp. FJAT-53711]|uniref:Uncharacterized protein n=1 Tax=Bacillus yunxiaonensis TaxID=3127665 RepID=A0ABU8FU20_9BACI
MKKAVFSLMVIMTAFTMVLGVQSTDIKQGTPVVEDAHGDTG